MQYAIRPEDEARKKIDQQLRDAGWVIYSYPYFDPSAGTGVAVREYPTEQGPADYLLMVDEKPVGILEAKSAEKGDKLMAAEGQAEGYARARLHYTTRQDVLPYVYVTNGEVIRFSNLQDSKPRFREIFHFHQPDTLREALDQQPPLQQRLTQIPPLPHQNLRDCQIQAIENLEASFKEQKPRALVQMATGSGKTFTAITVVYRLLKYAKANRILFLVDTRNLGEQAKQEFDQYQPFDSNRKFTELYNVQKLGGNQIYDSSKVCISTIQRMYSILKGQELDEEADEQSPGSLQHLQPKEVTYNPDVPVETFDFIIIDECHRSIYNLWRQVLDYFDAFMIGLTATPDKRTFGFFEENLVSEYSHEKAVVDGVNVGYQVYMIETEITQNGAEIKAGERVDKRDKRTRRQRQEELDEDVEYANTKLDKDVVNPSQIRNIIKTFRQKLFVDLFPGRREVPKTLIFAKNDSHADDIIRMVREEFGESQDFCKKVTYRVKQQGEDPQSVLQQFRNKYHPRIAVTVDMIATGTDVKPIECLVFMRDVKSRNYLEQMKGRGTRTYGMDDLRQVTPSAPDSKREFWVVDCIGVTRSVKTDSRPLERKPSVSMQKLMRSVTMGEHDEDTLTSLANRLQRLEKQVTDKEREKVKEHTGGVSINELAENLLTAHDPDKAEDYARANLQTEAEQEQEPSEQQLEEAKARMARAAAKPFYDPGFQEYLEQVRQTHEQLIDTANTDTVTYAGLAEGSQEKAQETVRQFQAFIEANKDEITALRLFYSEPYQRKDLTFRMVKELNEKLRENQPPLAPAQVWQAYARLEDVRGQQPQNELTALVSLVRKVVGLDEVLTSFSQTVDRRFREWIFQQNAGPAQFTDEQTEWLRLIKEHIATSISLDQEDLDNTPFAEKGGLARMYQLFGNQMDDVMEELNETLVA
jgi:type I restriction enzyme R subunit